MTTTSKEYAEALYELAASEGCAAEAGEGLHLVMDTMEAEPAYRALLASPAINRETRLEGLNSAFRGKVPEVLLGVLRMMITRGHIREIGDMAAHYEALTRDVRGETVARVMSAVPLRPEEEAALREGLERKFGRKVTLQCRVDPALLGCMRVEIDGRVIDGSIRNKLDQIKEVMHV